MQRGALRRLHRPGRRRAATLVHHARAHGGGRGDDDRGPARASARRRVRPGRRRPVRLLHARPGRLGGRARRGEPGADARGDPARDGREHLPLRHISQDRGGDSHVGKADPHRERGRGTLRGGLDRRRGGSARAVARGAARGRRPARSAQVDGHERVRGEARYTADIRLPGMLQAAVLRSPHAHARVQRIDLGARARPAGRPRRDRPGRGARARRRSGIRRRGGRRRRGRHVRPGARGGRGDRDRVGGARGRARPGRSRHAASSSPPSPARTSAATSSKAFAAADVVVEGDLPHADRPPQLDGDAPGDLRVAGRHAATSTSRRSSSGASAQSVAETLGAAGGQGARRLRVHGRRLRLEEQSRRVHLRRRRAREADGAAGALRPDAARGAHRRGQSQRDRPAAARRRAQRRDDRRARRRVHERRRLVGLERLDRGADEDALRLRERPHASPTARRSTRRR